MTSSPAAEPVCSHCLGHQRYSPVAWHLPDEQCCPRCGCAYNGPPRTAAYAALVKAGIAVDVHTPDQGVDRPKTTPKVVKGIA